MLFSTFSQIFFWIFLLTNLAIIVGSASGAYRKLRAAESRKSVLLRIAAAALLWTAADHGHSSKYGPAKCRAIRPDGHGQQVDCNTKLPVLCTQSAPASNFTFADTSRTYQISQRTGSQSLVGYRDFYNFRFMGVRFALEPERCVYDGWIMGRMD